MAESKKQYFSPEVLQMMELGKAGKLWTIAVRYSCLNDENQTEIKSWKRRNLKSSELKELREGIFQLGIAIVIEPGHWRVIPPMDFISVDLYRQSGYFLT